MLVTVGVRRIVYWGLAIAYVTAGYLALERAPRIWHDIQEVLDGHGRQVLIVLYAIVGVVGAVTIARARHRSLAKHATTVGLVAAFGAMYFVEKSSGETFHMLQYGVLGLLLFLALRVDLDPRRSALYATGIAIGTIAGLVDELLQGFLPNRTFTVHDVIVNGASAALVLVFMRVHLLPPATIARDIS